MYSIPFVLSTSLDQQTGIFLSSTPPFLLLVIPIVSITSPLSFSSTERFQQASRHSDGQTRQVKYLLLSTFGSVTSHLHILNANIRECLRQCGVLLKHDSSAWGYIFLQIITYCQISQNFGQDRGLGAGLQRRIPHVEDDKKHGLAAFSHA